MEDFFKILGIFVVLFVGYKLFIRQRISSLASAGNPNYPPQQSELGLGPQGPNDGSNNYDINGHTVSPIPQISGSSQMLRVGTFSAGNLVDSRGFAYAASRQPNVY